MVIGDDLHLDVARMGEEALDVQLGTAERRLRLSSGGGQGVVDRLGIGDHAHAPTAAAVHRLDRQRPAERLAERRTASASSTVSIAPGTGGTPASRAVCRAATLSPIRAITSAVGPIHVSPAAVTAAAKSARSRQEAVAGVQRVAARLDAGADDAVDVEVGLARPSSRRGRPRDRRAPRPSIRRRARCARRQLRCRGGGTPGSHARRSRHGWRRAHGRSLQRPFHRRQTSARSLRSSGHRPPAGPRSSWPHGRSLAGARSLAPHWALNSEFERSAGAQCAARRCSPRSCARPGAGRVRAAVRRTRGGRRRRRASGSARRPRRGCR